MSEANPSKVRKFLNQNSMVVTIITLMVLVGSIAAILMYNRPTVYEPMEVYYYDLDTNELFEGMSDDIPPVTAPSGGYGVRAYVYTCSSCTDPDALFIGYLEMFTREAKEMMNRPTGSTADITPEEEMMLLQQGHLVRAVEGEGWVPESSEAGLMITDAPYEICGEGSMVRPCEPGLE